MEPQISIKTASKKLYSDLMICYNIYEMQKGHWDIDPDPIVSTKRAVMLACMRSFIHCILERVLAHPL